MKKVISIFCILGIALAGFADDVVFKASAPKQVIVGKPFQLTYTVNQRSRDLRTPEFTDFDVLSGPYSSTSSSTSFVNGKRTSMFEQTYTFMIMAQREGTYTIGPATVKVNGDQVQSNGVRIQVLPADQTATSQPSNPSQPSRPSQSSQSNQTSSVSSENLFVRTIVSKTRVHEQEALLVTYKLYFANVDVAQLTNNTKLPEFTGFLKQELENGEIQTELEHYNGRNYQTAVLYRTVLYPQHSGDIQIDPARFEAVLRVQTQQRGPRSIFDDFFATYTNVTKMLTAPGVTIHVSALPSGKPAGFSGGVGRFTLTPSISQTELQANEAVTIKLDISGAGNMKLLKTPAIDWPEGFEPYDPKVTNNFKTTAAGVSGTKSIEYLAIPRSAGEYTIPAVQFSYFDIDEKAYKTLKTPEYTIRVKRGAKSEGREVGSESQVVSYTQKEDIKQLGTDIRYIDTQKVESRKSNIESFRYELIWLWYVVPLILAIIVLVVLRKQIKENADATRVRYKRANKVAQKRLKAAAAALKANNKDAFYAAIEQAAWSYLSDRLSIPTAELNKDNITSILQQKGISDALISEVKKVLSTAEFARYAPGTDHAMDDLYSATTNLINKLEEQKI